MNEIPFLLAMLGIFASSLLGITSNWIYDLLKGRGIFPDKPSARSVLTMLLLTGPLLVVAAIGQVNDLSGQYVPLNLWQALSISLGLLIVGYWLGLRQPFSFADKQVIRQITFDYKDSPVNHGWRVEGSPILNHPADGFWGRALQIESPSGYRLNYALDPNAQQGTTVAFSAKYETKAVVYIGLAIQSRDNSIYENLWLKIYPGEQLPQMIPSSRPGWHEWIYYQAPTPEQGNWQHFSIDLKRAVQDTVGQNGWQLCRLEHLRIRGKIALRYISILR